MRIGEIIDRRVWRCEEQNMYTNNQAGRRLDFSKISNRNTKIVSSEVALRGVKSNRKI